MGVTQKVLGILEFISHSLLQADVSFHRTVYAFAKLNVPDDFLGFVCQTADISVRLRHFHVYSRLSANCELRIEQITFFYILNAQLINGIFQNRYLKNTLYVENYAYKFTRLINLLSTK